MTTLMTNNIILKTMIAGLLCVLLSISFISFMLIKHRKVVQQVHVPTFQRGDCFEFNEDKESWETLSAPDGIIERVGLNNYLVLFKKAAEQRGGNKYASKMPIVTFDLYHHKVTCPETWVYHTHKKN